MDTSTILAQLNETNVAPDREGQQGSLPYCYWKRRDGWITFGPNWPIEANRKMRKGMSCLDAYGEFQLANSNLMVQTPYGVVSLNGWQPNLDPYRLILLKGGAIEFPVGQIIELGWHKKAPLPGVTFPQLTGVEIAERRCPTCTREFSALSEEQADHILRKHESIAHKDVSQQNQLARSIADATTQENKPLADIMVAIASQLQAQGAILTALIEKIAGEPAAKSTNK